MGCMVVEGQEDDAHFMRSCDASLMRMGGTANGDEYEEEEACGASWIQEGGKLDGRKRGVRSFGFFFSGREISRS